MNLSALQKRDVDTLAEKLGVTRQWLLRAVRSARHSKIQSKKGKLGRIVINPENGFPNSSYATHVIRRLEKQVEGGKYDIAQKMQAAGGLTGPEKLLIEQIMKKSRSRAALVTLVAECNVDPARVVKLYAEGAIALGKAEALAVAAAGLGSVARQLIKQAAVNRVSCLTCLGSGKVPGRTGTKNDARFGSEDVPCPSCKGEGATEEVGKHYKFAVTKLLDLGLNKQDQGGVNVTQTVAVQQNALGETSNFMERLAKLTDGAGAVAQLPEGSVTAALPAVEAEVVQQEDSPEPAEQSGS